MVKYVPIKPQKFTKFICPNCKQKFARVGAMKGSNLDGLTLKCKYCGKIWSVKTTND